MDAQLELAGPAARVLFAVEFKSVVSRSDVIAHEVENQRRGMPTILVSRYLPPTLQAELRSRSIGYADATGNVFLASSEPLLAVSQSGATSDPWRTPGRPPAGLTGLPAFRIVRALIDYSPPYTLPELSSAANASLGATYRLAEHLMDEGLVAKSGRGPVTDVDWSNLLYRWSDATHERNWAGARGYVEPRGLDALRARLRGYESGHRYAVSGSLAAEPYAPYAEPRLALLYADDPDDIARELGLRRVDVGGNVMVNKPLSPAVFDRVTQWHDMTLVSPSQAAADLLGGPGRNPAEGEHLVDWMRGHEDVWRRELDH